MNTPAHAVLNLLVLGRRDRSSLFAPIALGAVLPDVPLFLFYFYERTWLGTPEATIWSESYSRLDWQALFDLFHSLPLFAVVALVGYAAKLPRLVAVCASMMMHAVFDLLLHHDDAHRHFFPFSKWRFSSPVSYWDPKYYGGIVSSIEILMVVVGAVWLLRQYPARGPRSLLSLILASYGLLIAYALVVWM